MPILDINHFTPSHPPLSGSLFIHKLAIEPSLQYLNVDDVFCCHFHDILIKHHKVSQLSFLD